MSDKYIRMVEYDTGKTRIIKIYLCAIFNIPYENVHVRKSQNEEYSYNMIFIKFNNFAYSCSLKAFNEVPEELLLRNIVLEYTKEKINMIR